jgi:3-oxoacyl-[acyl-carrier protein] reductase
MPDLFTPSAAIDSTRRVAVVTGSSSGIGRAIALELAAAGADVLIHAGHNRSAAATTAEEVRTLGGQSTVLVTDLADPPQVQPFAHSAWAWRGRVDIWVNNAGADILTGDAANQSFQQKLELLWQVDVAATVLLSRVVGAQMKQRGQGSIVNIGWDQAETGMAGDSGELFAATKGAVAAFSRSLAKSLAPQVRVNCVAPGWIKTAWGQQASPPWHERVAKETLLERWGTPEEVAHMVGFLASSRAEYITGQVIAVNGGSKS